MEKLDRVFGNMLKSACPPNDHSVDKKSLQVQKLKQILSDRMDAIRSEYALERGAAKFGV